MCFQYFPGIPASQLVLEFRKCRSLRFYFFKLPFIAHGDNRLYGWIRERAEEVELKAVNAARSLNLKCVEHAPHVTDRSLPQNIDAGTRGNGLFRACLESKPRPDLGDLVPYFVMNEYLILLILGTLRLTLNG